MDDIAGIDDDCGSLDDLCASAGARFDLEPVTATGTVPGIISVLELSLDVPNVCCSNSKISLMSLAIVRSNDATCFDNSSILVFKCSSGRPGPLSKSPNGTH